jgi:hypothetical protein
MRKKLLASVARRKMKLGELLDRNKESSHKDKIESPILVNMS